ncbi:MAG: sulfurtransferase [Magnetococcales bacterium]|nr:sulfurtransferase [Magnetococcales bacterium]
MSISWAEGADSDGTALFVDTAWLEAHLEDDTLRIIQVGGDTIYPRVHIPGAVLLPMMAILTQREGVPGMLADAGSLTQLFGDLGITPQTHVVAYDPTGGLDASRLVWTLAQMGHQRASVLDGGLGAWYEEQRPMSPEVPRITPVTFEAAPTQASYADMAHVQAIAEEEKAAYLVDTRGENEYLGRTLRGPRGHIPGAVHVDWSASLLGPRDPKLKEFAELKALYAQVGVTDLSKPVVVYCQTAHRASQSWVLLRAMGFQDVRLYDGSMSEWGLRGMPVVSGGSPR